MYINNFDSRNHQTKFKNKNKKPLKILYLRRHNLAENLTIASHLKPHEKTKKTHTNENQLMTPQIQKQ